MHSHGLLWYHKGILEQAGVDVTAMESWEDVLEVIGALQNNCPDVLPLYYNDPSGNLFNAILFANGGSLIDEVGNYILESAEIKESLEYYTDLMDLGINPSLVEMGETREEAGYSFAEGSMAMALGGSGFVDAFAEDGTSPWPEYGEQLGVMQMPAREGSESSRSTALRVDCFLVTKESGNPRAAVDFIMHCMKPENYKAAALSMKGIAVSPKVTEDPEYQSFPFRTELTQLLKNGFQGELTLNIQEEGFYNSVNGLVERVLEGGYTAEESMEQYHREDMELLYEPEQLTTEQSDSK